MNKYNILFALWVVLAVVDLAIIVLMLKNPEIVVLLSL
jgi:hypothetical protein